MILTFLLTMSFLLFFESRVESFAPQLKHILEAKAESAMGGRLRFSIGDVDGGVFRPFILNEIKLKDEKDSVVFSSLEIKSIRLNYTIWDFLFQKKVFGSVLNFLSADPYIYITFGTKDKELSGFARLKGTVDDADMKGYVILFEKHRIDFNARLKAGSFELELRPRKGALKVKGSFSEDGILLTDVKIDHLKFGSFDVVADAVLKHHISKGIISANTDCLEGELETKNLILNYAPFDNIRAAYRIYNGKLDISNLEIGKDFKIHGRIRLGEPYTMNLVCLADNANLNKITDLFGKQEDAILSGTMNGKFEVRGPLKRLKSVVHMEIRKGEISGLDFDYLTASLKGEGAIVRIEDSRITRPSGYFALAGDMDFSKFGKSAMFQSITVVTDEKAILWDSWNVGKVPGAQEIKMQKKMSDEVNLGFKKFVADEKIDESLRDTDEVELEYKLHPNESLKVIFGKDKDFFGLEHKDKF